eukprot:COSAG02_NODE_57180_length_281_cov_1.445055_1_plen_43_part_01
MLWRGLYWKPSLTLHGRLPRPTLCELRTRVVAPRIHRAMQPVL